MPTTPSSQTETNAIPMRECSVVVIGHGASENKDSCAPVLQHAATLRSSGQFAEVLEGFWQQDPHLTKVVQQATSQRIFIVPLFISEGYFTGQVIPEALGFKTRDQPDWSRHMVRDGREFIYCRPAGSHPAMTEVLLARARSVVEQHPFPRKPAPADTTLFIAGHGTPRNKQSRQSIELQVKRIEAMNLYASVQPAFMEEPPFIADCWTAAPTRNLVMVPFFISDGLHTVEDIPVLLGEPEKTVQKRFQAGQPTWPNPTGRHGKLLWYAPAIGSEPLMADVIRECILEAAVNQ